MRSSPLTGLGVWGYYADGSICLVPLASLFFLESSLAFLLAARTRAASFERSRACFVRMLPCLRRLRAVSSSTRTTSFLLLGMRTSLIRSLGERADVGTGGDVWPAQFRSDRGVLFRMGRDVLYFHEHLHIANLMLQVPVTGVSSATDDRGNKTTDTFPAIWAVRSLPIYTRRVDEKGARGKRALAERR